MVDGVPFTLSYSVMPDHRAAPKGLGNTYSVRKFSHYGRQAGDAHGLGRKVAAHAHAWSPHLPALHSLFPATEAI
jgi:hypothetical protein